MTDKVIVYGGRGGLGIAVVKAFKAAGFWVASVDLAANDQADANVLVRVEEVGRIAQVSLADGWVEQEAAVCRGVDEALQGAKVVAVINVAGGWAGGCASDQVPPPWPHQVLVAGLGEERGPDVEAECVEQRHRGQPRGQVACRTQPHPCQGARPLPCPA